MSAPPVRIGTGLSACATNCGGIQTADSAAKRFEFGAYAPKAVSDLSGTGTSLTLSSDKRIAALLFDGARAELVTKEAPLSAAAMLTGELQTELPDEQTFLGYLFVLRGTIEKSAYAAASLTVTFAGTTKLIDWRYGEEASETFETPVFAILRRPQRSQNPQVPPLPPAALVVAIVLQRDAPGEHIGVYLSSIDIEVIND